jgi:hypothetical protein
MVAEMIDNAPNRFSLEHLFTNLQSTKLQVAALDRQGRSVVWVDINSAEGPSINFGRVPSGQQQRSLVRSNRYFKYL